MDADLFESLDLESPQQQQGAPFPGPLGRPSTYKSIVSRILRMKVAGSVQKTDTASKSIAAVRLVKNRTSGEMKKTGRVSRETVVVVAKKKVPKYVKNTASKKAKEAEEEEEIPEENPPSEEEYSDEEEEKPTAKRVSLAFNPVISGSKAPTTKKTAALPEVVREIQKGYDVYNTKASSGSGNRVSSRGSEFHIHNILDDYAEAVQEQEDTGENEIELELELRFSNITKKVFFDALARYPKISPVETTNEYIGEVRRVVRKTGNLVSFGWILKELVKKVDFPSYLIAFSKEYTISKSAGETGTIRKRTRYTYVVGPNKEYNLDFTIVETSTLIPRQSGEGKSPKNGPRRRNQASSSTAPDRTPPVTTYEVELEHRKGTPIPTLDQMKEFADSLKIGNYFDVLNEVGKLISRNGSNLHRLLTQAISLDRNSYYATLFGEGFYLTDKLNGRRTLVFIKDGMEYVVQAPNVLVSSKPTSVLGVHVLDCEMYEGDIHVLDIVYPAVYGNIKDRVARAPRGYILKQYYYVSTPAEIEAVAKKLYLGGKAAGKDLDGLIIADRGNDYFVTTNYKWKPEEFQTIDFGLKLVDTHTQAGKKTVYDYDLYVMIKRDLARSMGLVQSSTFAAEKTTDDYIKIQFCPALDPIAYEYTTTNGTLDGQILEMSRVNGAWKILRVRDDKEAPNNYKTAEDVFNHYYYPFTLEMLWEQPDSGYYPYKKKSGDYKNYFSAMRHMFAEVVAATRGEVLLEAGAGQGGDIMTYLKERVAKVLATDKDIGALVKLVVRRYPSPDHIGKNVTDIMAYLHAFGDYDPEFAETVSEVYGIRQFDKVVANLSAHYFMDTEEKTDNTLRQFAEVLKTGGRYIITGLDEDKVKKEILFGSRKNPRFHIIPVGDDKVSVLMPFSGEMKEETPIHYSWLVEYGKKYGFTVEKRPLRSNYTLLSPDDVEYTALHVAYILTKN